MEGRGERHSIRSAEAKFGGGGTKGEGVTFKPLRWRRGFGKATCTRVPKSAFVKQSCQKALIIEKLVHGVLE